MKELTFDLFPKVHPQKLENFPSAWGDEPSQEWLDLCNQLQAYTPPPRTLTISRPQRKWEAVSAFQKSIRRGKKDWALKMVSAFDSLPGEYGYLWRRTCTTACEDIGPANPTLVLFVIACATLYTPKSAPDMQYKVLCFLAGKMSASEKSRIWCELALLDKDKDTVPNLVTCQWDEDLIKALREESFYNIPLTMWARKNAWRAEGLLRFISFNFPLHFDGKLYGVPESKILYGLPACAYDTHTKTGKAAIIRATGIKELKEFFAEHPIAVKKQELLAEALFRVEGRMMNNWLFNVGLQELDNRRLYTKLGFSLDEWAGFLEIVCKLVADGKIDAIRKHVLIDAY